MSSALREKMEVERLLGNGKIIQLQGLSNFQWDSSIVSIDERSVENDGVTKLVCEIILGETKGKKVKVKETKLMEFQLYLQKSSIA